MLLGTPTASAATAALAQRVAGYDWPLIEQQLDRTGHARLPALLGRDECTALCALFRSVNLFRKTIDMQRHAYGSGRYGYFDYPLPELVGALRSVLYPPLCAIANRWHAALGVATRYPESLAAFLSRCHDAGQRRPTPLLLRYAAGDYNRMHQDVYGELAFPLQVACVLSPPKDRAAAGFEAAGGFEGGEFLISESRARMQTRTTAVRLALGEGIVFANAVRPVASVRGHARAVMRHGLSTVLAGERMALGIIFHDAT